MSKTESDPPMHQWTHNGDRVLIVKNVSPDGSAHNGFKWPLIVGAIVKPDVFSRKPNCESGGLFGWPWGLGIGDGKGPNALDTWIVFSALPQNVISIDQKCKVCPNEKDENECARIEFVGAQADALAFTIKGRVAWIEKLASGSASATGESGSASATGWSGSASATGWRGSASATGWRGSASATGWSGSASATGESGSASATGGSGISCVTGEYGTVEVSKDGIAAVTANQFTWKILKGAILIARWKTPVGKSKHKLFDSSKMRVKDGDKINISFGKIMKELK